MERYRPGVKLEELARELVHVRFPKATSAYTADGAIIYDTDDTELGKASAGEWAVEHAWQDAAVKLLPAGTTLADEWKDWATKLTAAVRAAVANGIYVERYTDYPSPVEGFCFELFADLPNGRPVLRDHVLEQMKTLPAYQDVDAQFRQKYGRPALHQQ